MLGWIKPWTFCILCDRRLKNTLQSKNDFASHLKWNLVSNPAFVRSNQFKIDCLASALDPDLTYT